MRRRNLGEVALGSRALLRFRALIRSGSDCTDGLRQSRVSSRGICDTLLQRTEPAFCPTEQHLHSPPPRDHKAPFRRAVLFPGQVYFSRASFTPTACKEHGTFPSQSSPPSSPSKPRQAAAADASLPLCLPVVRAGWQRSAPSAVPRGHHNLSLITLPVQSVTALQGRAMSS